MSEQGTVSRLFFTTVGLSLVVCENSVYVDIVDLERVLTAIADGSAFRAGQRSVFPARLKTRRHLSESRPTRDL
jgi:hypothetical protein